MTQVKQGDTVRIHYTGTTEGETFDSSEGREPLEFQVGSGQIIPGLDAAVSGMEVGESKTVDIPKDQAYGDVDPSARQSVPRGQVPDNIPLEAGTRLQMQTPQGQVIPVTVVEVTDEEVVLDANHPLAGKDLTFKVEVVEVAEAG
ncbi:FKBP-type peptidyl-prolyl cis-trans isomerase [Pseudoroseicyclus aestuarii]|uniref:Peptidyl-prolyl cis-trans isomerase n=1 Tax=Pseudoroseicyclus aestuarii TaxID=1795041 RepID=A0A318SQH0_9RHOB|nr:peptidylprolyl isomerase [Pseudoroseicyclus aestuarii]PYE84131.1 peptidylprolyl isomerase [Pseudoroseicyclus aestuarii]